MKFTRKIIDSTVDRSMDPIEGSFKVLSFPRPLFYSSWLEIILLRYFQTSLREILNRALSKYFRLQFSFWKRGLGPKQFLSRLLGPIFCTIYEPFLERGVPGRGGPAALVTPRPDRKPSAWSSFETVELSFPSVLPILIINSGVEPEIGEERIFPSLERKRRRNRRKE